MIPEVLAQLPVDVQLVLDPQRTGHQERPEPSRHDAEVGLEDALELEQRLVVEARQPSRSSTPMPRVSRQYVDGAVREGRVALLAGEALL